MYLPNNHHAKKNEGKDKMMINACSYIYRWMIIDTVSYFIWMYVRSSPSPCIYGQYVIVSGNLNYALATIFAATNTQLTPYFEGLAGKQNATQEVKP